MKPEAPPMNATDDGDREPMHIRRTPKGIIVKNQPMILNRLGGEYLALARALALGRSVRQFVRREIRQTNGRTARPRKPAPAGRAALLARAKKAR
ncbi:hypothetical protein PZC41_14180 [Staphylococcus aureus]|uniref:hypothetical protein n=1 Tax=Staphylococcus aureus TaxID=1280 RepID=UPI0023AFE16F|nr:hypothetical protein [Staphylococcus aureus]MDE8535452.1 hypothetical protein [Staphylococcus aureus]